MFLSLEVILQIKLSSPVGSRSLSSPPEPAKALQEELKEIEGAEEAMAEAVPGLDPPVDGNTTGDGVANESQEPVDPMNTEQDVPTEAPAASIPEIPEPNMVCEKMVKPIPIL